MSRKKRKHKKRVYKNVTLNYIVINSEKQPDKKVTPLQKLAFLSTIITLISAIITLIAKLIEWGRGAKAPNPIKSISFFLLIVKSV